MCSKQYQQSIAIAILVLVSQIACQEKEMTVRIAPGAQDCFYETVQMGQVIDVEYQVVDGGLGDLDISFSLIEPTGRVIYGDFKKSDNIHRHKVMVSGDYRFCFDNSFSLISKKTVFFEIIIENENGQPIDEEWNQNTLFEGFTPEEYYDMKVEDIQNSIGRVRQHLTKARQTQDLLKSYEARDRNIAEENYFRVNVWSVFQIFLMIAVGALQVYMVRSLFEPDSKVNTIWKKLYM